MVLTRKRRAVPLANKMTMVSINKAESEAKVKLYRDRVQILFPS